MNTKLNLIMAATAVLGLASCEKYVPATANEDDVEYVIVIDGAEGTKATASRSLDFADLTGNRTGTFTATLQKRNRETGYMENVSFQPDWSWSKDSDAFSGSRKSGEPNKYEFAAQAVGGGNVNVSASYCGNALASSSATVTVADSRAISWTNPTSTVTSGNIYSATLNCNFAGTVTVSSNNSSFLVGESTGSLSSTASVTFSESTGTAKTIYYKYTGSQETTVNMNAGNGSISAETLVINATTGSNHISVYLNVMNNAAQMTVAQLHVSAKNSGGTTLSTKTATYSSSASSTLAAQELNIGEYENITVTYNWCAAASVYPLLMAGTDNYVTEGGDYVSDTKATAVNQQITLTVPKSAIVDDKCYIDLVLGSSLSAINPKMTVTTYNAVSGSRYTVYLYCLKSNIGDEVLESTVVQNAHSTMSWTNGNSTSANDVKDVDIPAAVAFSNVTLYLYAQVTAQYTDYYARDKSLRISIGGETVGVVASVYDSSTHVYGRAMTLHTSTPWSNSRYSVNGMLTYTQYNDNWQSSTDCCRLTHHSSVPATLSVQESVVSDYIYIAN